MNHYNPKDEDDPKHSATDKAIVLPKEQECDEKKANNHKQSHHSWPDVDNQNHRSSNKNYRSCLVNFTGEETTPQGRSGESTVLALRNGQRRTC